MDRGSVWSIAVARPSLYLGHMQIILEEPLECDQTVFFAFHLVLSEVSLNDIELTAEWVLYDEDKFVEFGQELTIGLLMNLG